MDVFLSILTTRTGVKATDELRRGENIIQRNLQASGYYLVAPIFHLSDMLA